MQSVEKQPEPSTRDGKRSFNRFLVLVIILMIVTATLSIWDNWGGDVVEATGPDEQKMLELPNDVKIVLNANSEVRFQKGSAHKLILRGSATITAGAKKITIETLDLIANARNARLELLAHEGESYAKVIQGSVDLILKPSKTETITLLSGQEYRHSLMEE